MTREEAVELLCYGDWLNVISEHIGKTDTERIAEAMSIVGKALRPVSREQVEKVWKGEWEWYDEEVGSPLEGIEREWGWQCSKCKVVLPDDFDDPDNPPAMRFCQWCGAPMTDESVDMVMEKINNMEEMTNEH